jgi:hypothetical protein
MSHIDHNALKSILEEGRFKKLPTFVVETIECDDDPSDVRLILADKPNGRELGIVLSRDLAEVLSSAASAGLDTEKTNPNMSVLRFAFSEAQKFSGKAEEIFTRAAEREANKVVSIFTREPV